jgi:hypothetical protein
MKTDTPDIKEIMALVRKSGAAGCTAAYLVRRTGGTEQAVAAALRLQVEAGIVTTEEVWIGERYQYKLYRLREGLPS